MDRGWSSEEAIFETIFPLASIPERRLINASLWKVSQSENKKDTME